MSLMRYYQKHEAMLLDSMPDELRDKLQHSVLLHRRFRQAVESFETYEQFIDGLVVLLLEHEQELRRQLIDMANTTPRPIIVASTALEDNKL